MNNKFNRKTYEKLIRKTIKRSRKKYGGKKSTSQVKTPSNELSIHIEDRHYSRPIKHAYNLTNIKRAVAFALFCIFIYMILATLSININYIWVSPSEFISDIEVETFKSALNNSLPIINVTYNSGNIGNPISVQLKSLLKGVFGFDINTPVSILNIQSPYLQTYYNNTYLPYITAKALNDSSNEKTAEYETLDNPFDNYDGDQELNSQDNIASRGNDREEINRKSNIELVDGGVISYYYYEGEEEKLEAPKENIVTDQKIAIMNMTNYKIDEEKDIKRLLSEPLKLKTDRDGPKILILHTHTSESFAKSLEDINNKKAVDWSINPQENVVRVGHELADQLKKKYGLDVIHNGTEHDRPDYNKSYIKSYDTIEQYLKSYPSIKMVLDIHRDGLGSNQPKLRVVKNIEGKDVAQIMFVVGTDANGLLHPNWKENLKLALKLQTNLNNQYPGLARHIYISSNRYNQQFTNGSLIVEIGGNGNLLSECLESVKYLSKAISEVIK